MKIVCAFMMLVCMVGLILGYSLRVEDLKYQISGLEMQISQRDNTIETVLEHMFDQDKETKILKVLLKQCGAQIPEPPEVTQ